VTAAGVEIEKLDDRLLADALIANHGVDVYKPRWDEPALSTAEERHFAERHLLKRADSSSLVESTEPSRLV
jgi:hypothetical protein